MRRVTYSVQQVNLERRKACLQLGALAVLFTVAPTHAANPANSRRIVSVGGALTEIVFVLQANADLVGVDTTSLYPESAQKLPSVGYARSLSIEGVLALAPTQVIATEDAGPPAVLRQLSASGISVNVLAANHRFEGLNERIKRIGELTGRVAQANTMQQTLQQEWVRVRAQVAQRTTKPVRVLFVLAHTPNQVMVAGTDTSAHAMLDYVGAANAINGFSGYKPLTPEAVIAAQPDIILLTDQGLKAAGGMDGILKLPGLEQTAAGRSRRVISMEAMFLLGFGPRLPAAVSALDAAIEKMMRV
ncbi:heme/hemin ABC transporter substrate-binding protein [Rhodoferax sp.]|uniref:heme/hemin ABC transporter substrate-binding protein n=1 Tax=Rhodoferax sp. TaxID=50421 RepID=UPI002ACDC086|nr:ABC transporter substrate-binding protein [Rhodoferax sp.]MDZ7920560.1 ABC transporter substrate-binding protein [Rhodoferax sp.]